VGGLLARCNRQGRRGQECMRMEFSSFFTTNVRPVTTLDDLRFMTSLPVVDLTSCRQYLNFFLMLQYCAPENWMSSRSCHWNESLQGSWFAKVDQMFRFSFSLMLSLSVSPNRESSPQSEGPAVRPSIYHHDAPPLATTLADRSPHSNC